jgi:hypothetical protein
MIDKQGFDTIRRARVADTMRYGSRDGDILEEFVATLKRLNLALCDTEIAFGTAAARDACHLAMNDARMLVLEYDKEWPEAQGQG